MDGCGRIVVPKYEPHESECCLPGYFPAALASAATLGRTRRQKYLILTTMLFNPALVLIDHGHFQFNCINLGFVVRSMYSFNGRAFRVERFVSFS
jgi:hypothetical protein